MLLEFVDQGGRLVIGGSDPFYLHRLRDQPPVWSPSGSSRLRRDRPAPRQHPARCRPRAAARGADAGSGSCSRTRASAALVTGVTRRPRRHPVPGRRLAARERVPRARRQRRVRARVSRATGGPSISSKAYTATARAGVSARYPTPWKVALGVLAAAALALAWSRSRRFGPPDRPQRGLAARPRRVRARARSVARTHA